MDCPPNIAMVDDDETVRNSLTALFSSAGYSSESYSSAEAFMAAFDPSRVGCLLVDVNMPGMGGLELQRWLRSGNAELPVILLTGHGDVRMAVDAMKAGAFDFIEKPYDNNDLLDGIVRALEHAKQIHQQLVSVREVIDRIAGLTPRERDVLDELVAGQPNKAIARKLGISPRTVEIHRARVMEKMQSDSLAHLVRMTVAAGL
jgi:two-component system, LuxR family, response regulator FixJ